MPGMDAKPLPRVLIADDNPQGAELLEAYLGEAEFDTRLAADGEEALRLAREWKPDILLLDVMMPRLSGFEVCKRLRADPDTRHVSVLMVTALDQAGDIDRAVEAGTDDFLTKPINKADLLVRVRALAACRDKPADLERTLAYFAAVRQSAR
jgi:DNA-binding response OmpR family regulator